MTESVRDAVKREELGDETNTRSEISRRRGNGRRAEMLLGLVQPRRLDLHRLGVRAGSPTGVWMACSMR